MTFDLDADPVVAVGEGVVVDPAPTLGRRGEKVCMMEIRDGLVPFVSDCDPDCGASAIEAAVEREEYALARKSDLLNETVALFEHFQRVRDVTALHPSVAIGSQHVEQRVALWF